MVGSTLIWSLQHPVIKNKKQNCNQRGPGGVERSYIQVLNRRTRQGGITTSFTLGIPHPCSIGLNCLTFSPDLLPCCLSCLTFWNIGGLGSEGPNKGTSSRAVTATYPKEQTFFNLGATTKLLLPADRTCGTSELKNSYAASHPAPTATSRRPPGSP